MLNSWMGRAVRGSLIVGALGIATEAVRAEGPTVPVQPVIANGGLLHTLEAEPVIGQPYSAVQVSRMIRTLADGTKIKKGGGPGHEVARDSAGRVRVEQRLSNGRDGQPAVMMVFVLDPVKHALTIWTTGGVGEKTAILIKIPNERSPKPAPATGSGESESNRPQLVVTTENLGTETVQGLPVEVVKTTTVVPAGRAGNDAPITKTHEVWTSPDLKLTLKELWEDPRSGERTVELINFARAEPDAALFRAPADYKVKDLKETMKELQERLEKLQN